jgi:hypothetical protein
MISALKIFNIPPTSLDSAPAFLLQVSKEAEKANSGDNTPQNKQIVKAEDGKKQIKKPLKVKLESDDRGPYVAIQNDDWDGDGEVEDLQVRLGRLIARVPKDSVQQKGIIATYKDKVRYNGIIRLECTPSSKRTLSYVNYPREKSFTFGDKGNIVIPPYSEIIGDAGRKEREFFQNNWYIIIRVEFQLNPGKLALLDPTRPEAIITVGYAKSSREEPTWSQPMVLKERSNQIWEHD